MLGLNWIDLLIILLLVASVLAGVKMGVVNQLAVVGSGFASFFLAGWLLPHVLPIHDRTLQTIVNSNLVLLVSAYVALKGFDYSRKLHWRFGKAEQASPRLKMLDASLGCAPAIIGSLLAIWLLGAMFMRMPFEGLSNSISSSKISQTLNAELPPIPKFVAILDRQVNPNAQPAVLTQPKTSSDFNYSIDQVNQAAAAAEASVVRVTSFGCGGIVTGSGFVVGPGLIMTNAHVIAGVKRPIVKYHGRSYVGLPVVFDVSRDIAVLRLDNFSQPAIKLSDQPAAINGTVVVIGYPDGNFTVSPGIVRNRLTVFDRNIYDEGLFSHQIYEVQTNVDFGSSGSPLLLPNGRVGGLVFSKSINPSGYAYALAADELRPVIGRAAKSYRRVGTGACLAS